MIALLLALGAGSAGPPPAQDPGSAPASERELLEGFVAELPRLRQGDDAALAPLERLADELCAEHGRCDPADVLAYYAGLSPGERRQGAEAERAYRELRARVFDAAREGLAGEDWARERREVLAELELLILEVRHRADFVPAAQALALCARIELQRLEESPYLAPRELAELTALVARDAQASSELFRSAGQVTPRLEPLWILGRVERSRGRTALARDAFEGCRESATLVGRDDFRERAILGLLSLALDDGDVAEQERQLRHLATFRAPGESWPVARGWAELLLQDDHPERALEFLLSNEPLDDAHPGDRGEWHLLVGGAEMRLGRTERARLHFEALAAGPSSDLATLALARLAVSERRPAEALGLLEREGLLGRLGPVDRAGWHALAGEAHLLGGRTPAAIEALRRALEIADDWERGRQPRGEGQSTARSIMGEWSGLHTVALLAQAQARLGRPLGALAAIEDAQSRSLRPGRDGPRRPITSGDVLAWARHTELGVVSWVVGADFTVVAWAGPDGSGRTRAMARPIDLGRRRLEDAARRLREAALSNDSRAVQRIASEVRSALFPGELLERLRSARSAAGRDPRLLLLLHGPLERLPVELLEIDGLFLDDFLTPVALPGLPAPAPGDRPRLRESTWTLLGAPVGGLGRELPGAREELAALAELHEGARLVAGAAFVPAAVRGALRGGDPVHVATHLIPDCEHRDLRLSPAGLVLSKGEVLCAHDVAELHPRAPLVVLSACATAEGGAVDAEGLHGMARAFLESGTRSVLVTLWPVEDATAQAFALAFHRALAIGHAPSRAAARARRELRKAGRGPRDWAAFRLLGRD